ncbi:MAG TPA: cupin domain-containing protein [Candidatus Gallimonas gallistercoris]|uniref:Cupin domain-containing protein n=1 Tax=Candidatus Gallimonas gallistercoris TaxID=2838602 RepID=A0A9D2KEB4_9FIRM|nr:cupin domain-containing protein [Candidatus Gallimonas gallistercoris]
MLAKREIWNYPEGAKVWAGKYRNSHNLLHWHFDCEFISVERGKLEVFCEKKLHTLAEGEALFTDSGQMHYQRALEPDTVLRVIVFEVPSFPRWKRSGCFRPSLRAFTPSLRRTRGF